MLRVATLAFRRLIGPTKTAWERGSSAVKNHFSNGKKIVCCPRELYQLLYFRLRKGVKFFSCWGWSCRSFLTVYNKLFPPRRTLKTASSPYLTLTERLVPKFGPLGRIFWDHRENKAQLVCLVYLCLGFQIHQSWRWRILGFFSVSALECQPEIGFLIVLCTPFWRSYTSIYPPLSNSGK